MKRLLATLMLIAALPAFSASFPMTLYPLATGLTNVNIFLGAQGGLTRLIPFSLIQSNVAVGPVGAVQWKSPVTGIMGGDAGFLYSPTLFQASVSNMASGAFAQYGAGFAVVQTNDPILSLRGTVTGDAKSIGSVEAQSYNDASTMMQMVLLNMRKMNDAAGAEEGAIDFGIAKAGAVTNLLSIEATKITARVPIVDASGNPLTASSAVSNEVFITIRSDGAAGTGTRSDPFDGSTQPRLDGIFTNRLDGYHFKLGPGTYETKAAGDNARFKNFAMTGAGVGLTTLKGIPYAISNNQTYVIDFQPFSGTTNRWASVRDLTVDCNFAAITNGLMGGIIGQADNAIVENVAVINSGVTNNALEIFSINIAGSTNAIIRGNRVQHSAGYWGGILITTDTTLSLGSRNFIISENIVTGQSGVGSGAQVGIALAGTLNGGVVENNFVDNVTYGIFGDVGAFTNITVRGNTVRLPITLAFGVGIYINSTAGPTLVTDGVSVNDNTVWISANENGISFRDAAATGLAHRNIRVSGNIVRIQPGGTTTSTTGLQIYSVTGGSVRNNRYDSTLANIATISVSTNISTLGDRLLTGADATGALDTFNSITLGGVNRTSWPSGSQGLSTNWVNGAEVVGANFTNSATVTWSINGTNIMASGLAASVTNGLATTAYADLSLTEAEASLLYQATNANLTALAAVGTALTNGLATTAYADLSLTQAEASALYQGTNANLTALAAVGTALTNGLSALASPTFTGDPKAPTPAENDNDTSIATTAYVQTEIAGLGGSDPLTIGALNVKTNAQGFSITTNAAWSIPLFLTAGNISGTNYYVDLNRGDTFVNVSGGYVHFAWLTNAPTTTNWSVYSTWRIRANGLNVTCMWDSAWFPIGGQLHTNVAVILTNQTATVAYAFDRWSGGTNVQYGFGVRPTYP